MQFESENFLMDCSYCLSLRKKIRDLKPWEGKAHRSKRWPHQFKQLDGRPTRTAISPQVVVPEPWRSACCPIAIAHLTSKLHSCDRTVNPAPRQVLRRI